MGARKDLPDLGGVPSSLTEFADYLVSTAAYLLGNAPLGIAIQSLALATRAFRAGDLCEMGRYANAGLEQLSVMVAWWTPPEKVDLKTVLLAETGHELMFIATHATYRSGDIEQGRILAEEWSNLINSWEITLGQMDRTRYQYYQLAGNLCYEVGLMSDALRAYSMALDYAPTPYRKAFLWMSMAQVERETGLSDESWEHAVDAIDAWLQSPYPQTAGTWIEWLSLEAGTDEKHAAIDTFRIRKDTAGGVEINRVNRAMTELYHLLADLHRGADPATLVHRLDPLVEELERAGSWPNLVTILATGAVIAGRLGDRETVDSTIERAREIISSKLAPDARPPVEFFLESAHALALRDVGEYDDAFNTMFERALEARTKYPGAVGPEEQTAIEALYYLGALAGHDPVKIEKRVRATLAKIS
jgi:hypothetical protein